MVNKIVVFDFDGTITTKDSFNEFLIYRFGYVKFFRVLIFNSFHIIMYLLKRKTNAEMKSKLFKYFYKNTSYEEYKKDCTSFSKNKLNEIIRPSVLKKIHDYEKAKIKMVILTASFKEWIEPWAKKNGFEKVIATKFEVKDSLIIGTIKEKNSCHAENKVNMLLSEYQNLEQYYLIAYGDSKSDLYFMNLADEKHFIKGRD